MPKPPAIAVFDIGRTNRKVVVFDEGYDVLDMRLLETDETMEDGRISLDLEKLRSQVDSNTAALLADPRWDLKAVNFATYGATMVWLGGDGEPVHPVVDYMAPFPDDCRISFEEEHGPLREVCMRTASPWLGNLNSGLQLYACKKRRPEDFRLIRHAVHLPQYLSSILTGRLFSETTGIGCHTLTWDFRRGCFDDWVVKEGIDRLFPGMHGADDPVSVEVGGSRLLVGAGVHDSSSALIPYLKGMEPPFLLLSTGTWSICLNPFAGGALTDEELDSDCLNYLRTDGGPVKASRMPLGMEHDRMLERLCRSHGWEPGEVRATEWDGDLHDSLQRGGMSGISSVDDLCTASGISQAEAYHGLMHRLMERQLDRVRRVLSQGVDKLHVDGGFSRNQVFMRMLARMLPSLSVCSAELGQSTATGAAMVLHARVFGGDMPGSPVRTLEVRS